MSDGQILEIVLSVLTVGAALYTVFSNNNTRAALALGLLGFGVGAIYLQMNLEFLAIVQWFVSSVSCVLLLFLSHFLGEGGEKPKFYRVLISVVIAGMLGFGIYLGTLQLNKASDASHVRFDDGTMREVGAILLGHHTLESELVGISLFVVIIGIALILRQGAKE